MRRISSSLTLFYKRIFPAVWFGILAIFMCRAVPAAIQGADPVAVAMFVIMPILMASFGYLFFRAWVFDLLDEVYLDNDEMVVRNAGGEDRFPVMNILNVSATQFMSPERITLTLREACQFGEDITSSPPLRMFPFARHPLEKELIRLAHNAPPTR
jgi:hypothetical protein